MAGILVGLGERHAGTDGGVGGHLEKQQLGGRRHQHEGGVAGFLRQGLVEELAEDIGDLPVAAQGGGGDHAGEAAVARGQARQGAVHLLLGGQGIIEGLALLQDGGQHRHGGPARTEARGAVGGLAARAGPARAGFATG